MKKSLLYLLIALCLSSVTACKKSFLDETPISVEAAQSVYTTKAGFESGLYGAYDLVRLERAGVLKSDPANNPEYEPMMIGVDNAYGNRQSAQTTIYNYFSYLNSSNPTDQYNSARCANLYQVVNAVNTIIQQASNPNISWTNAEKNQILGEAMIIRAWAYRHISYLWGPMPLVTAPSVIRTNWVRTPVAQIRAQIEQDLLFAEANCADAPIVEGRFPRAVATHYLTELYLAEGRYAEARDKALSIINDGRYSLVTQRYGVNASKSGTPFTDMFISGNSLYSQGNTEAIWVIPNVYPIPGVTNNNGSAYNIMRRYWVSAYDKITGLSLINSIGRGLGRDAPTSYALSLYDPSDDRGSKYAWHWKWPYPSPRTDSLPTVYVAGTATIDTLAQTNWPCTTKWDWADPSLGGGSVASENSNGNDQIYLRLGETYLFLAEAYMRLGDNANAAKYINILRARAHAPQVNASDITQDFILDERSRELFSEEHRRYTLLRMRDSQNPAFPAWYTRTLKYNHVAGTPVPWASNQTPNLTLRDTLLPVPQDVIDANLTLTMPQNPGY